MHYGFSNTYDRLQRLRTYFEEKPVPNEKRLYKYEGDSLKNSMTIQGLRDVPMLQFRVSPFYTSVFCERTFSPHKKR